MITGVLTNPAFIVDHSALAQTDETNNGGTDYRGVAMKGYYTSAKQDRELENEFNITSNYYNNSLRLISEAGININIKIAQNIRENHSLFAEFLEMIGVEDDAAYLDLDVEGIEHYLHPQTKERLEKLIPILKKKSNRTSLMNS